ncbi:MAG: DUF2790 domain-containing protein [Pseudomonas sp.]
MKALVFLALAGYACVSLAAEPSDSQAQPAVEQYAYGMELDVARVISISNDNHECAVGPAWITFEDHQGQRHTVEYRQMGDGCSNG